VVRVSHERAHILECGSMVGVTGSGTGDSGDSGDISSLLTDEEADELDPSAPLRPVTAADFREATKKLKASVDDNGRELQKVMDWNDKYGEVKKSAASKRSSKAGSHMSLYI
jgi:hypothetical protein